MSELHIADGTSSIGAVWPPAPSTHERLRGFFHEGVIDNTTAVDSFVSEFDAFRRTMAATDEYTRLSVRAVVAPELLAPLDQAGATVEAVLPLAAPYEPLVVAYTGWNTPGRTVPEPVIASHAATLRSVIDQPQLTDDPATTLAERGFTPAFVDARTPEAERRVLVPRFAGLYAMFGYSAEQTAALLFDPNNVIAYIEQGDEVVSTAMAEFGELLIKDLGILSIAEITEASTAPDYRGRGLYRAVSALLIRRLLTQNARPLHAIYGESNLAMPGTLIAGHQNGRQFSHFDGPRYGLARPSFGILPQNFSVLDGVETRRYNDFALSYVAGGAL